MRLPRRLTNLLLLKHRNEIIQRTARDLGIQLVKMSRYDSICVNWEEIDWKRYPARLKAIERIEVMRWKIR